MSDELDMKAAAVRDACAGLRAGKSCCLREALEGLASIEYARNVGALRLSDFSIVRREQCQLPDCKHRTLRSMAITLETAESWKAWKRSSE